MNDNETKFIELSKQLESLKTQMKELAPVMEELLLELGEGAFFQDPTDNVVFKVIKPKGTFISFKTIDYHRTKRGEEKKGNLSMKDAKDAGYTL